MFSPRQLLIGLVPALFQRTVFAHLLSHVGPPLFSVRRLLLVPSTAALSTRTKFLIAPAFRTAPALSATH
jgi:hypothetical protein